MVIKITFRNTILLDNKISKKSSHINSYQNIFMMLICSNLIMTTLESSQQEIQKHRTNCRNLLALSSKVRYAGVINKFGRTLAGQLRKDVTPLFKPDEARNEFFIEATRNQLRKNFEPSIGKTDYTFTENEKVNILTLSHETNFYYITFDKDIGFQELRKIIESVKKLVRQEQPN